MEITRRRLLVALALSPVLSALPLRAATSPEQLRIIALEWLPTELLLALGVTPLAVADTRNYNVWVGEPPLPPHTIDVGLRIEPNIELMTQLQPSLILCSNGYRPPPEKLQRISPIMCFDLNRGDGKPFSAARDSLRALATRIGSEAEAHLQMLDRELAAARQRLAPYAQRPILLMSLMDSRNALAFGKNSLFLEVMEQLGLTNAWQGETNFWGSAVMGIERLAHLRDVYCSRAGTHAGDALMRHRYFPAVLLGLLFVLALLVGAGLGLAGLLFQQALRNPLAEPTTLGVSSGAQLGITVATLWQLPGDVATTQLAALIGAVVFGVAWGKRLSPVTLMGLDYGVARNLGMALTLTRVSTLAILLSAQLVSVAGIIGFIGLFAPLLVPLLGALLLWLADACVLWLTAHWREVSTGTVTALTGVPLLLWRAPRLLAALAVGLMLGVAGSLIQRLTGNPMASPEVLGISSGAAFGVVVILFFVLGDALAFLLPASALGAAGTLLIIMLVASRGGFSPERMLLAGMALNSAFVTLLMLLLASGDRRMGSLLSWISGSTYNISEKAAIQSAVLALVLRLR